jgi:hypothetical protein
MTLKVKAILAGIGAFLLIGVLPNLLALSAGIAYSPALLLSGLTGGVFVAMGVLNLSGNKQAPLADAQARAGFVPAPTGWHGALDRGARRDRGQVQRRGP